MSVATMSQKSSERNEFVASTHVHKLFKNVLMQFFLKHNFVTVKF